MKKNYRTIDDVELEYLKTHPEEIDEYIKEMIDEYEQDGNKRVFLVSLKNLLKVKNIDLNMLAERIGIEEQVLFKIFSLEHDLSFEILIKIFNVLGYALTIRPMDKIEV